jgi:hypothetical protein
MRLDEEYLAPAKHPLFRLVGVIQETKKLHKGSFKGFGPFILEFKARFVDDKAAVESDATSHRALERVISLRSVSN